MNVDDFCLKHTTLVTMSNFFHTYFPGGYDDDMRDDREDNDLVPTLMPLSLSQVIYS